MVGSSARCGVAREDNVAAAEPYGFFFSSRRRHTRLQGDWSSDVCSSDLPPPAHIAPAISSRIKVMANLDIAERRMPQDGRIELNVNNQPIDLRVSVLPTMFEIGRASCRERV